MASNLDEDVALFQILRERLLGRLGEQEADLRSSLEKTRDAKRDVLGRGRRGTASEPGAGTHQDRVLSWLRANAGHHAVAAIARAAGLDRACTNQALVALYGARLVSRPERGRYEAAVGALLLPAHGSEEATRADPPPEATPRRETPADRLRRMREAEDLRRASASKSSPNRPGSSRA